MTPVSARRAVVTIALMVVGFGAVICHAGVTLHDGKSCAVPDPRKTKPITRITPMRYEGLAVGVSFAKPEFQVGEPISATVTFAAQKGSYTLINPSMDPRMYCPGRLRLFDQSGTYMGDLNAPTFSFICGGDGTLLREGRVIVATVDRLALGMACRALPAGKYTVQFVLDSPAVRAGTGYSETPGTWTEPRIPVAASAVVGLNVVAKATESKP